MAIFRLIQTSLSWEDPATNREHLASRLGGSQGSLNILPEMFSTGFSMASDDLAETMDGPTIAWMRGQAAEKEISLCGSLIIRDKQTYNRFIHVSPDGNLQTYDKRHLFRMAGEHQHYHPGEKRLVFVHDGMRIMAQVCYDLRFPVFSRNRDDYDVLLFVANWPAARREHWLALLRARAIENQSYVIGVNRTGVDGNNISHAGDSCVIDYRGDILLDLADREAEAEIPLEQGPLQAYRQGFPAWQDADEFTLNQGTSD